MYYYTTYMSPLGEITLACDTEGKNIVGAWLKGQEYFLGTLGTEQGRAKRLPVLLQACAWLDRYFAGEKPVPQELPLAPAGNKFRQTVWSRLKQIPYGQVLTYGELAGQVAQDLGRDKMSARAVGGAVGHNPISIIIPCHRVIGANGKLTGYAGGLEKKVQLLRLEGIPVPAAK